MTEPTSVGADLLAAAGCACSATPDASNSIVESNRKESVDDGCCCHSTS
jgi:hypothetical protein